MTVGHKSGASVRPIPAVDGVRSIWHLHRAEPKSNKSKLPSVLLRAFFTMVTRFGIRRGPEVYQ
jgi:hypothetical protein